MKSGQYRREKVFISGFPVMVDFVRGKGCIATDPLYHPEIEFQLVRQGQCEYFVRDTNYQLKRNSLLVIHKNEVHSCIQSIESYVKKISMILSPRIMNDRAVASNVLRDLRSVHHLILPGKQAFKAELLLEDIAEECRLQDSRWREAVVSDIERFLLILNRAASSEAAAPPSVNPLMQEVLNYLEERFTERLLLADVASRFNMSPYSLSRTFKLYVGMGFKEYIIHRRIVEAGKLLEETDLKISTIALKVGFEDLSNFYRTFRLLTSVKPSAYRKILH